MMIISELNSINLRLNYGNNITIKSKEENLSHLKERYTMASEHIIHERVAKIENSNEIFNENVNQIIKLADENSFDNDDNIELF